MQSVRSVHSFRVLLALVLREVEAGGLKGPNSLVWAVIEPVVGISLLSIIFMIALPAPPLGNSFALFYATGLLPLLFFQDVSQKSIIAIRFSRPLLGFAEIRLIEMIVGRAVLAMGLQVGIMILLLGGLLMANRHPIQTDVLHLAQAILATATLSTGVGVLGGWLSAEVPIWPRIWAAVLRPLVFISGVFFLVDEISDPYRDIAMWNPLAHAISAFRAGFYPQYIGEHASLTYVFGIGLGCLAIGVVGLRARQPTLMDQLI